jgi:hypothetical protein
MKKLLLILICVPLIFSCGEKDTGYNKNMETFKVVVSEVNSYFENPDLKEINISKYYTEDFVFHSYAAGNKKGQETVKSEYISYLEKMKMMGMSINIGHSIYLPGIDEKTFDLDGSVRVYYGATISIDTNHIDFSGYQTINFKNEKISEIWEWADYGGISSQLYEKTITNL